jgi:methionyl-tRNA formyltransferase
MKLFIIGQKWLGAAVLKMAVRTPHKVIGVCCPRLAAEGSLDRLYVEAAERQITVCASYHPPALQREILPLGIDLILAAHATWRIGPEILAAARLGGVGYHPSLLPRHRGPDAVRWTLAMHEPVAGGSLYRLDEEMDGGPIVIQTFCHVAPGDTAAALWRRELAPMGVRLFEAFLSDPERYLNQATPQDASLATAESRFTPVASQVHTPVSSP